jgi:urea transport system substrate-binding protein
MNLSRMGVYLWKQAVEKAGSFEVDKVRDRAHRPEIQGPGRRSHHAGQPPPDQQRLHRRDPANGQFKIIKTFTGVAGEPFSEKFLPAWAGYLLPDPSPSLFSYMGG